MSRTKWYRPASGLARGTRGAASRAGNRSAGFARWSAVRAVDVARERLRVRLGDDPVAEFPCVLR